MILLLFRVLTFFFYNGGSTHVYLFFVVKSLDNYSFLFFFSIKSTYLMCKYCSLAFDVVHHVIGEVYL